MTDVTLQLNHKKKSLKTIETVQLPTKFCSWMDLEGAVLKK